MLCDTCKNPTHCANLGRCPMRTGTLSALDKQVSGNHYKDKGIQPIVYIHAKQQMGQRTPVVLVETSASEACCYIPISHLEHPKRA